MENIYTMVPILFGAGLLAGFINAIAGGGGMVTIPVLLALNIDPKLAIGTNKLQATLGSITATANYVLKGQVKLRENLLGILLTAIGAVAGAFVTFHLSSAFLKLIIPFALLLVLIYSLINRKMGLAESNQKIKLRSFYLIFGVLIGFYDGFFGPGTGSFWMVAIMHFLGYEMRKAAATMKLMNFTSNFCSLCIYFCLGLVNLTYGLTMGVGAIVGAKIGSNLAILKGAKFIRPVFLTIISIAIVYTFIKYVL